MLDFAAARPARSLYYALLSALRELAVRGAEGSESYIVGRKELESAREKLGIKGFLRTMPDGDLLRVFRTLIQAAAKHHRVEAERKALQEALTDAQLVVLSLQQRKPLAEVRSWKVAQKPEVSEASRQGKARGKPTGRTAAPNGTVSFLIPNYIFRIVRNSLTDMTLESCDTRAPAARRRGDALPFPFAFLHSARQS